MMTEEEIDSVPAEFEPGERTRRGRRRRRGRRAVAIIAAMALMTGGAWAGTRLLDGRGGSAGGARFAGAEDGQTTMLFMIRQADDLTRRSDMLVVFALDATGANPVALFLPSNTLTEIPGHGLDLAGRGYSFGGMPLQSIVVDNILGIALDRDAAMTDEVFGRLVDDAGGLDIDVEGTLLRDDGTGRNAADFSPGSQHMDGEAVRRFLRFQAPDETELSRIARARQVWEALIDRWGKMGPGTLAQRFRSIGKEWNQGIETGLAPLDMAEFFSAFAAVKTDDRIYTTLPVSPVSAGGAEQALQIDAGQTSDLVREYFAASMPANPYRGTRIEILNGNGVPQIGETIALKVVPKGFRIVLNRNARAFDFPVTKIVVYSRDERSLGAARKIRELLGVGEIEVGLRVQTVVDVTIVVGHDFQPEGQ